MRHALTALLLLYVAACRSARGDSAAEASSCADQVARLEARLQPLVERPSLIAPEEIDVPRTSARGVAVHGLNAGLLL